MFLTQKHVKYKSPNDFYISTFTRYDMPILHHRQSGKMPLYHFEYIKIFQDVKELKKDCLCDKLNKTDHRNRTALKQDSPISIINVFYLTLYFYQNISFSILPVPSGPVCLRRISGFQVRGIVRRNQ